MNSKGFTLLEVLAAMAVLTVVLAIVYGTFDAVTKTMEIGRDEAEALRKQQYLLRTIRGALESAAVYTGGDSSWVIFDGVDGSDREGDADSLTLLAATPPRGGAGLPGDLTQVRISVSGAETGEATTQLRAEIGEPERRLVISQVPVLSVPASDVEDVLNVDRDKLEEGLTEMAPEFSIPVQSANIDYYDGSVDEWLDDWSYEDLQRLPWAVRFRISFPRTEEERAEDRQARLDPKEDADVEVFIALPPGLGLFEDSTLVGALR